MVAPRSLTLAFTGGALFLACSTSDHPSEPAKAPATLDAGASEAAPDAPQARYPILPYPPGPYGPAVGETMADFRVQGYALSRTERDSRRLPFRDVTLSEVRSDPSCRCLLVMWAAAGLACGPCVDASAAMSSVVLDHPDICGLEVIHFSYDGYVPGEAPPAPTRADLDQFVQATRSPYPVGLFTKSASDALAGESLPGIPDFYVVRPGDMRIVGFIAGTPAALEEPVKKLCATPASPMETIATGLDPRGLALDGTHVWMTVAERGLVRVARSGGVVETIDSVGAAGGDHVVLADAVYWTTSGTEPAIRRTPFDGGPSETIATTSAAVESVAYGAGELFVATIDGRIAAYPGPRIVRTDEPHPTSLVVTGSTLLWANLGTGEVVKSALDGSGRTVIASPGSLPDGAMAQQVAYRSGDVLVRTRASATLSHIAMTDIDGKPADRVTTSFAMSTFALDPRPTENRLVLANRDVHRDIDSLGFVGARADTRGDNLPSDLVLGQHLVEHVVVAEDGATYWTTRPRPGDPAKGMLRRRNF